MSPDRWLVVGVELPDGADGEWAADILVSLGATAVEERGRTLVTHLPPPDGGDEGARSTVDRIRRRLDATTGSIRGEESGPRAAGFDVTWSWQPHEEWAETWKRGLAPRRVGERLLVTPTWMEPEVGPGDLVLRIDPGVAFGTAEHATTRMCLAFLEDFVAPGDRLVDAGSGTGILSIAAALLGAARITAVESDSMACEAARENFVLNDVSDRIHLLEEELDAPTLAALGPADGVMANIQSHVLLALLPGAAECVRPGGWIILGGVLRSEAGEVKDAASARGFHLLGETEEDEWWSGSLRL